MAPLGALAEIAERPRRDSRELGGDVIGRPAWIAAMIRRFWSSASLLPAFGRRVRMAGYAFARIRFFAGNAVFVLLLATLMVPYQVTIIPEFLVVRWLGEHLSPAIGVDSLGALVLPNFVQVFGIFMLRQFFRTLPIELEEAARIDGTSRAGTLIKIVLPLSLPAISTLAALMFLRTWNDFLWPLIVVNTQAHYTLQLGLAAFQGAHTTSWTLLMAGNVMSMIPLLIVFFAAQKYFIRSVATSGLKG